MGQLLTGFLKFGVGPAVEGQLDTGFLEHGRIAQPPVRVLVLGGQSVILAVDLVGDHVGSAQLFHRVEAVSGQVVGHVVSHAGLLPVDQAGLSAVTHVNVDLVTAHQVGLQLQVAVVVIDVTGILHLDALIGVFLVEVIAQLLIAVLGLHAAPQLQGDGLLGLLGGSGLGGLGGVVGGFGVAGLGVVGGLGSTGCQAQDHHHNQDDGKQFLHGIPPHIVCFAWEADIRGASPGTDSGVAGCRFSSYRPTAFPSCAYILAKFSQFVNGILKIIF